MYYVLEKRKKRNYFNRFRKKIIADKRASQIIIRERKKGYFKHIQMAQLPLQKKHGAGTAHKAASA